MFKSGTETKLSDSSSKEQAAIPDVQVRLRDLLQKRFASDLFSLPESRFEYGLTFGVKRPSARNVFSALKAEEHFRFEMLIDITAVDWLDRHEPRFDVVYQLLSLQYSQRLTIKIQVEETDPEVDSVRDLWPAANFLEREVWDMYGIHFKGHGDLRRILMYDEFVGHPLRKDYPKTKKQPRVNLRSPEVRNNSVDMHREELVSLPVRQRINQNIVSK